jgi:hypothetical protein
VPDRFPDDRYRLSIADGGDLGGRGGSAADRDLSQIGDPSVPLYPATGRRFREGGHLSTARGRGLSGPADHRSALDHDRI